MLLSSSMSATILRKRRFSFYRSLQRLTSAHAGVQLAPSDERGRLRSSVDALGTSLGLETGRRMVIGETFQRTPRAWLSHSSIDIDTFTDAVGARASFADRIVLSAVSGPLHRLCAPGKAGSFLGTVHWTSSRRSTAGARVQTYQESS